MNARMRRTQLLLAIGLWTLSTSAQAPSPPEGPTVREPDFSEVFCGLDATGTLIPLERQTAAIRSKASGFIVMTMKSVLDLPGERSPIRFHAGDKLEFVVRSEIASSTLDPGSLYCLRKLERKKNKRELVIMAGRISPIGASAKTDLAQDVVPGDFSLYGQSSIRVSAGALSPGEYALSVAFAPVVFCFGVD